MYLKQYVSSWSIDSSEIVFNIIHRADIEEKRLEERRKEEAEKKKLHNKAKSVGRKSAAALMGMFGGGESKKKSVVDNSLEVAGKSQKLEKRYSDDGLELDPKDSDYCFLEEDTSEAEEREAEEKEETFSLLTNLAVRLCGYLDKYPQTGRGKWNLMPSMKTRYRPFI